MVVISGGWGFRFRSNITFKFQSWSLLHESGVALLRICRFGGSWGVKNAKPRWSSRVDELASIFPRNAFLLEVLFDNFQGLLVNVKSKKFADIVLGSSLIHLTRSCRNLTLTWVRLLFASGSPTFTAIATKLITGDFCLTNSLTSFVVVYCCLLNTCGLAIRSK